MIEVRRSVADRVRGLRPERDDQRSADHDSQAHLSLLDRLPRLSYAAVEARSKSSRAAVRSAADAPVLPVGQDLAPLGARQVAATDQACVPLPRLGSYVP